MKNEQINDLAYAALDAACASIQDALGVKTGDFAGMYFSGERHDAIITILADYIGAEISEGVQHRINELEDVLRALLDDDNENTRIRAEMALE